MHEQKVSRVIVFLTAHQRVVLYTAGGMEIENLIEGKWYITHADEWPANLVDLLEKAESMIAAQARDLRMQQTPDTATEF